jgi:hypothetical protein
MKAAQAFASGPVDTSPVEEGDGERVMNVLEVYRTSVSRPRKFRRRSCSISEAPAHARRIDTEVSHE